MPKNPLRQKLAALFLALVAGFPALAYSQGSGGGLYMSLEQCISYALNNNPNIQIARFDEYIAQKQFKEILGVGLPQVKGQVEVQDFLEIPTSLVPGEFFGAPPGTLVPVQFGTQYSISGSVSATQLIFDGTFFVGLQASKAVAELNRINIERSKTETASEVSKAYYTALVSKERLGYLDNQIARLQDLMKTMKALYEQGFAEKIEVDRLTITLKNLEVEQQKALRLVELTMDMLKFQMGMDIDQEIILTDKIEESENLPLPDDVLEDSVNISDRVEMKLLNQQYALHQLDLKRHKAGYLPSLVAFGTFTKQYQGHDLKFSENRQQWFNIAVIGLNLSVPIFDGFQKAARVQQSKISLEKINTQKKQFTQGVKLEVQNARTQVINAWDNLKTLRENLSLAEEVYRVAKIKYEEGVGSNLELIDAESTLRESQTNYLSALYEYKLALIELKKAKGEILDSNTLK